MFNLIQQLFQFLRKALGLLPRTEDTDTLIKDLLDETIHEYTKAPVRLNRALRRQMAKHLAKHPDHKGMTHLNLPTECSQGEYMYWQQQVNEVLTP